MLDIVVPTYSQAKWLDLCLRAIKHFTPVPHRLIVVDHAAKYPVKERLKGCLERGEADQLVSLPKNISFSHVINSGVAAGSSPNVAIVCDDVIVTEGWAEAFLKDLNDPKVGLTGARAPGGASGFQGIADGGPINEPPFLVFVAVAFRRAVWDDVGPMDWQTFDGFSSEDVDYSWRVRKAGYQLKVSDATVLHGVSKSLKADLGAIEARQANDKKYNDRLYEKWGQEWVREQIQKYSVAR